MASPSSGDGRPLYGRFAWAYEAVVPRPGGGDPETIAAIVAASGVDAGSVIVDAGCGTGRYAERLADMGYHMIGVDLSPGLIEEARARGVHAVCADILTWQPPELVDALLCRGVLNDLTGDGVARAALAAFASWLRPDGVLVADVREWEATATRYADGARYDRLIEEDGRALRYSSETTLDAGRRLLRVRERYDDEMHDFAMRCWTEPELRADVAAAGFERIEFRAGGEVGIAPDRLLVTAASPRACI